MTNPEDQEVSDEDQSDNQQESNENQEDQESWPEDELLKLKKSFAREYFEKISWGGSLSWYVSDQIDNLAENRSINLADLFSDKKKFGWALLSETNTIEDYMTNEWILDNIKDKVLLRMLLKNMLEKETMEKLDSMKEQIDMVVTKEGLESLKSSVVADWSVVASGSSSEAYVQDPKQDEIGKEIENVSKDNEKYTSRKDKLLAILDKIIQYDKENPVKYNRWKRASLKEWLDCSGLVIYALRQIWLKEMWATSRDMFPKLETKKISDQSWKLDNNIDIKPWDLLFWDSKNPDYKFSTGPIPKITKDWQEYRVHHVAFVKKIDNSSGKITIVESNGKNWIVEREISPKEEMEKKHKSDLYVWSVKYDELLAYNWQKENLLNQVA